MNTTEPQTAGTEHDEMTAYLALLDALTPAHLDDLFDKDLDEFFDLLDTLESTTYVSW